MILIYNKFYQINKSRRLFINQYYILKFVSVDDLKVIKLKNLNII